MMASFRNWFCSITVILSSLQGYSQTHTPIWPETFEKYNKQTYSYDTLSLNSGSWIVNDAIIGNSNSDRKNGGKSLRIQNNGFITMNFDIMDSPNELSFYYGRYGNDAPAIMALYSSIDSGKTWIKYKNNIHASSILLTSCDVKIAHKKPIRFQIRKISGGRLNIDDINITNSKHIIYSKTTYSLNPKAFLPKTGSTCICNK